jgi:5-methylcytosine-specific restriction endonuclease McrA
MECALNSKVLVLNKSYVPINIKSAFEALCDVGAGRAMILDENYVLHDLDSWINTWSDASKLAKLPKEKIIHGPSCSIAVPEVIRSTFFKGVHNKRPRLSRSAVFARDENTCQYCGQKKSSALLNIDHVLPRSRGGKTIWTNVVLSCIECNSRKDNKTPEEADMKLLKKPIQPHWAIARSHFSMTSIPKSWEDFLGKVYWNAELEK